MRNGTMAELKVTCGSRQTVIQTEPGRLISDILRVQGIGIVSPCGGRGVCGKCAPRVAAPSGCLRQGDMRRLGRGASPMRPLSRGICVGPSDV